VPSISGLVIQAFHINLSFYKKKTAKLCPSAAAPTATWLFISRPRMVVSMGKTFIPVDIDKTSNDLNLLVEGRDRGKKAQSPSEAKDFDEMEHAVAARASNQFGISRPTYDQSLLIYSDRLSELNVSARSTEIRNESRAVLSIGQISRTGRSRLCT